MEPLKAGQASSLIAVVIVLGMLGWAVHGKLARPAGIDAPYRNIYGATGAAEEETFAALLREARDVLGSPQFQRNLAGLEPAYPVIYASAVAPAMPLLKAARLLAADQWNVRYAPLNVEVVGGPRARDTDLEAASAGQAFLEGVYADMTLGRGVLGLYRSEDQVARSCAINVGAHELAHTISTTPFIFTYAFTDTRAGQTAIAGRRDLTTPVGSYLIGAVAQCTWLQAKGRLGADGIGGCVRLFGTKSMNWARCGAFADGGPVEARPGLPVASSTL